MTASSEIDTARLLDVRDLVVEYSLGWGHPPLRAVDRVTFHVAAGETVGLVGESGSGKSTIARAILGLAPIHDGAVTFRGVDITRVRRRERIAATSDLQVVFQDPYSSLSPTKTVGQSLAEMLRVPKMPPRVEVMERIESMLSAVALPTDSAQRYPSNFSGGQRQRIAIARALMRRPSLVICDEAVSALDLSVQAQIMNLLSDLQGQMGLSYLFIAHDLPVVYHLSHRIIVLYRGRVMEQGDADAVYRFPAHPYTRTLLAAIPVPDPERQAARRRIRGPRNKPDAGAEGSLGGATACPFRPRCEYAIDICAEQVPALEQTPHGTFAACHRWSDLNETAVSVTDHRIAP